jgi:hypothetical protein
MCWKHPKLALGPQTPPNQLMKIAFHIFHNWDQVEQKRRERNEILRASLICGWLARYLDTSRSPNETPSEDMWNGCLLYLPATWALEPRVPATTTTSKNALLYLQVKGALDKGLPPDPNWIAMSNWRCDILSWPPLWSATAEGKNSGWTWMCLASPPDFLLIQGSFQFCFLTLDHCLPNIAEWWKLTELRPLSPGTSVQKAGLIALTRALKLTKTKR